MFLIALFLLFLGLKLANILAWSWFLVSLPLIIWVVRELFGYVFIACLKENISWAVRLHRWLKS